MTDIATALTKALTDTYALAVKTHAAHWNVTGPSFFALHEAFGAQYLALLQAADELAERLKALGTAAPTGMQALAKVTGIADLAGSSGQDLCRQLAADHRALSAICAAGVKAAQAAGDEATADLLIGRIEDHDKTAWMLTANI